MDFATSLKAHNTFGVEARALGLSKIKSSVELLKVFEKLKREKKKFLILGGGSNVLWVECLITRFLNAPFLSRSHQSVLGLTRAPIQAPPPINSANSRKTALQLARPPCMSRADTIPLPVIPFNNGSLL